MKKTVVAIIALAAFAGTAFAGDVIEFAAAKGPGKVTFPHKVHQVLLKDCKKCHTGTPGPITGFGKDFAHKTCKGCHTETGKGPTGCKDCHKR